MNYIFKNIFIFSYLCFSFSSSIRAEKHRTDTRPDSLKYYRDSFVKIKTSDGKVIYIDPYTVIDYSDSADIVLITHEHYDHNDLTRVRQKRSCHVIRAANAIQGGAYQSFTIGNIKITAVPAYNGYHSKSQCAGYVVEFNGIKLYHAGDTGKIAEMADLTAQNITYALLPMDGVYTMTPEQATQAAAIIQAKHDIPIHTSPVSDPYNVAIVARFTSPNKMVIRPDSTIALESGPAAVDEPHNRPQIFSLEQNYPNPFNPSTNISFNLQSESYVSLKIYDLLGREVATLVSEYLSSGNHSKPWNALSNPGGVYFYRLEAGSFSEVKKLLLLR